MRKFETILASHGVDYRSSGRFEILVRCPLCGSSDPSQHLAISTRGKGWRCLRNPRQHRGRSYSRLLSQILVCSIERAKELLGEQATPLPTVEEFSSSWRKQLGLSPEVSERPKVLHFPKEVKLLTLDAPRSLSFWEYLYERGYLVGEARWAVKNYDLHYALFGRFAYRIVIPIYSATGELLTWTGRSIDPNARIRYSTLPKDDARAPPGNLLLGLPTLYKAPKTRCLVICEGPFDAIAVSVLGHEFGVWGTCLFGLDLSEAQADLLVGLEERFDRMCLALDPEQAWLRILDMRSLLPRRRCEALILPPGYKDPGDLVKGKEGAAFIASLAA